jgi:hypothetical protein
MTQKSYRSKNIGPQPGEPLCDGNEHIIEKTNNAPKTDVEAWKKNQTQLSRSADKTSLNAYPLK